MSEKINLEKLLQEMTIKQKIAQLVQLGASFFTKSKSEITGPMEMMGLIGAGNNPMVGMTVAIAVAIEEAMNK